MASRAAMTRVPRSTYFGLFALAGSIILFQIALTRVFAIMMWHHLTYMVVSIALLGFGAAGSLLTARKRGPASGSPLLPITLASAAYAVSVLVSLVSVRAVPVDSLELWRDGSNFAALLGVYLIVAAPFLLGGLAVGMALTRFVGSVNTLYFSDLLGSALGGAASVALLAAVGSVGAVAVASAVGLLAAALFARGVPGGRARLVGLACLVAGVYLGVATLLPGLGLPRLDDKVAFAPGKELLPYQDDPGLVRLFSGTAEVEVSPSEPMWAAMGGDIGTGSQQLLPSRLVGQDGTAPTMLFENGADVDELEFLRSTQAASAYVAHASTGLTEPEVLVIGVGGGVDVLTALAFGARHVTAVEINTAMIEMVTERYADYIGGLFGVDHPDAERIELVNSEGRSYMRSRPDRYDVIQMSGVDSFTALNTGAYTLSESYLYTVEAVQEFYEHLTDGGIVNYSRFILTHPKKPRESLRLAHIAREALAGLGIAQPERHIAVLHGAAWASTMIKRGPFTDGEVEALERFAADEGFFGLVFDPRYPRGRPIDAARARSDRDIVMAHVLMGQFLGAYGVQASGDELERVVEALSQAWRSLADGDQPGAQAAMARLADGYPAARRPEVTAWATDVLLRLPPLEQIAVLADGVQRTRDDYATLLGGSADERARFVADYEYDLSACTDDKPFFFNYYRYRELFERLLADDSVADTGPTYHPDFPVGHMVLLSSLAQIAVLGWLLIFLPLRRLKRAGFSTRGGGRYFVYFAALGVGFMFVEIVLMQKLVIVLGHPTYAVSVVLASLLSFAGLGSLLAGRITDLGVRTLRRLGVAVVVLLVVTALLVQYATVPLLGLPLAGRVAACVLMILPVGLALGTAFPTGLRIVGQRAPHLLPWCWAINGFLSVFSSMLCIVIGMFVGFTSMLLLAAAVYAVGFAVMLPGGAQADGQAPAA